MWQFCLETVCFLKGTNIYHRSIPFSKYCGIPENSSIFNTNFIVYQTIFPIWLPLIMIGTDRKRLLHWWWWHGDHVGTLEFSSITLFDVSKTKKHESAYLWKLERKQLKLLLPPYRRFGKNWTQWWRLNCKKAHW